MILSESADPKKSTTYTGCYKQNSTTFGWENSSVLINVNFSTDVYRECQSKARGQELHLAQFEFDKNEQLSIRCKPETKIHIFEALLFDLTPECSGKDIKNVTTSIYNMCSAAEQCQIYDLIEAEYNVADGCIYERMNITFGCMYDRLFKLTRLTRYNEFNDDGSCSYKSCVNIEGIIVFGTFFGVPLVIFLCICCCCCYKRCGKYSQSGRMISPPPATGGTYPPPATGGTYPLPATGGTYPPPATGGTYPPPATGGNYPPPATGGNYPPPATGSNYPPPERGSTYPQPSFGGTYPPHATGGTYPSPAIGRFNPPAATGRFQPTTYNRTYQPTTCNRTHLLITCNRR
ncbi:uncharacterized protein LOC134825518 [Bolinopsis microptera]|uniref:uncharacterized protein LOC134825518 n=1 Tax=Bolinopsis microptera TaxID=2820187 RepID=UPI003079B557